MGARQPFSREIQRWLAALLLALGWPAAAALAQWTPIGPNGGQVNAVAATTDLVVYAGTNAAGVFRSVDGGLHWQTASGLGSSGLPPSPITALAVAPGNSTIVFAGTEDGLFESNDSGVLWAPVGDGLDAATCVAGGFVSSLAMAADASALYVEICGGLYKSQRFEESLTQVSFPAGHRPFTLTADPRRAPVLYAGVVGGLYRTRDGGATWDLLDAGFAANMLPSVAVDPATPDTLYAFPALTGGPQLVRSTDGGDSWTPLPSPVPLVQSLAVGPNGRVILAKGAAGHGPAILESVDGGVTWAPPPGGGPGDAIQALLPVVGGGSLVYAGGALGFWRSLDAGVHWRAFDDGLTAQDVTNLAIGSDGAATFLYATVSAPLAPVQTLLFRQKRLRGSGGSGNGGQAGGDWQQLSGAGATVLAVDPRQPETLYGFEPAPPSANLSKSRDGGATWTPLPYPGRFGPDLVKVDPQNPRLLYAGGIERTGNDMDCKVLRSTTAGASWRCMDPNLEMDALVIDPRRPLTLYLHFGTVYQSLNYGATWTAAGSGLPTDTVTSGLAIDPANPRQLYLGAGGGAGATAIYRSIDAGRSWSPHGTSLPVAVASLLVDPATPSVLYAGVIRSGVFVSPDRGETWCDVSDGLPAEQFTGQLLLDPLPPEQLYAVTEAGLFALGIPQGPGFAFCGQPR